MKKLLAATACALPFVLGGAVHAQGTKGPSGSGAANPSKQSRTDSSDDHRNERGKTTNSKKTNEPTDTPRLGDQGSSTSVAPSQPSTPRATEPGAGSNRSASGDSAGSQPRRQDDEGFR